MTSLFNDSQTNTFLCESPVETNIVEVQFPAVGISDPGANSIVLYPNPSSDVVNISSTAEVNTVEVMNYVGQPVYQATHVNSKTTRINVSTLRSGVYFVKVTTSEGIRTTKITVTH